MSTRDHHGPWGVPLALIIIGAWVGHLAWLLTADGPLDNDLAGFGRRFIDVTPEELADDVLYQIGALDALARAVGSRVRYVKPHGALYNRVVHDLEQAEAVLLGSGALPVLGLPGSVLLEIKSK